jgi:hypothetical protein
MQSDIDFGFHGTHIVRSGMRICLAAWNGTLHKKIIVAQLVKKFLTFYENLKVHSRLHKSPPPECTRHNHVESKSTSCFFQIYVNMPSYVRLYQPDIFFPLYVYFTIPCVFLISLLCKSFLHLTLLSLFWSGRRVCRIWGSHSGGCEEFYLLVYNFLLGLFFDPEDEGDIFLRNVGWLSTDYTALYPRR